MDKRRTHGKRDLGSAAKALFAAIRQLPNTLSTYIEIMRDGVWARLEFELARCFRGPSDMGPPDKIVSIADSEGLTQHADLKHSTDGIEELWLRLGEKWRGAVADPTTTTLRTWNDRTNKSELLKLATFAWCELLATPLDRKGEAKKATAAHRAAQVASVEAILQMLRTGAAGVETFAKTGLPKWMVRNVVNMGRMYWFPPWFSLDLAGAQLANLEMRCVHSARANFTDADLTNCDLGFGDLPGASFEGAILRGAKLRELKLIGAKLRRADCSRAQLQGISLRSADCSHVNFKDADLSYANLCRAVLTGANLEGANLEKARHDKDTQWPEGFRPTADLRWMGSGASPVARAQARLRAPKKPLNMAAFMKRLEKVADPAKLVKALDMLKAEHFKLFSEVKDGRLIGIVKSQVKANLIYSCTINHEGAYGCCTPDLKPCWGMRGTVCKHLLLLVIGLAKSGEIDRNVIDSWIQLAKGLKPVLPKQELADTLVRYKGAEAGEVDWRPTETIPEDFYAM